MKIAIFSCRCVTAGEMVQEGGLEVGPRRADVCCARERRLESLGRRFALALDNQFVGEKGQGDLVGGCQPPATQRHPDQAYWASLSQRGTNGMPCRRTSINGHECSKASICRGALDIPLSWPMSAPMIPLLACTNLECPSCPALWPSRPTRPIRKKSMAPLSKMRIYQIDYMRQEQSCFARFRGDSCAKYNKTSCRVEISVRLNVSVLLADGTDAKNCFIRENQAYAEVTGSFLNQFCTGTIGHDPLREFRGVENAVDVVEIRFDPDLSFEDGTITSRIPTTVFNVQLHEHDTITIIATYEIRDGQFRMTKGGDVVYEAPMSKLRALKHTNCSVC